MTTTSPAHRRYLRLNKLLPGDVLLSKGTGRESDMIARFTFGPFSHASLYIPPGLLFEAIGDGVGYTGLPVSRACDAQGTGYLADVTRYEQLQVRRHPALRDRCAIDQGWLDLTKQLTDALLPENGKEYPLPTALAYAGRYVPAFLLWPYLRYLQLKPEERSKKAPGLFCSQIVAQGLICVGAHPLRPGLFGGELPAKKISPNHLQSQRSLLEVVPDAIVDETFPCDEPETDPRREQARRVQHDRKLKDFRAQQRLALDPLDKHASLKFRLSLDELGRAFENLRETMTTIKGRN